MPKFRGFKASLNFAYTKNNKDKIENYPTGPENISLAGAYRANRDEFFGYGSLSEPHKKITPAMVKLPPSRSEQPDSPIPSSQGSSNLAQPSTNLPTAVLSKSTPEVSTNPSGRPVNENRDSTDLQTKNATKPPSKDQKLLERQQKKQKKIAEEKQAKLKKDQERAKKDQEKAEKEKEKQDREREKEQAKAAKRDKPKREKKSKSKAPPLPKSLPPATVENQALILDQLPTTESEPILTVHQPNTNKEIVDQQPKSIDVVIPAPPPMNQELTTSNPPPKIITQAPVIAAQEPKTTNQSSNNKSNQTNQIKSPKQSPKTVQPTAPSHQPKAAQRTNPLSQSFPNYSTDTLDSNISRNTGPPPYEEILPNTNDKAGNTSFGKRVDDSDNSWDLVSQHRQQLSRPMARQRRPKQMVMDLQFDSGFAKDKAENSEA